MPAIDPLMDEIASPDYQPMTNYADLRKFLSGKTYKTVLNDWLESWTAFTLAVSRKKLGQAFMNVLPPEYYNKLTDTPIDPFNEDTWYAIYRALDYLILSEV